MFRLPFIPHAIVVSALSHEGQPARLSVNPRCSYVWVLVR